MADWHPRANDIFLKAIDAVSPDERLALINSECGADAELRAEVESLLAVNAELGEFLERRAPGGTADPTVDSPWPAQAAAQIGPYKLLEPIGEGGMGIVYMAEQTQPVRRRVALKIIKDGMDTRQVVARFEAERQALAMMDHPSIARVFDAGTTDSGRPYFVMELVRGIPLTDYCEGNRLPLRERLELFVQVCQAVQHAHQKGIIHRDLKPSNVLVTLIDSRPVSKVIDFGVAKATGASLTERTLFTGFTQMIGTPLYMSPEQADMTSQDVDTRSDIYSLGVILYELLTGTTPFDRERLRNVAFDEFRRIIREEEPIPPSSRISTLRSGRTKTESPRRLDLDRLVAGDLDWIVLKALDKDRTRRYGTAAAFAKDIWRYLNDQLVEASPPSAIYRFRKFVRRNRVAFTTVAMVAAALVIGLVISVSEAIRANNAIELAEDRLTTEVQAKEDSRKQLQLAEKAELEATRQLFESRLAQARAAHRSRRIGQRLESLESVREAAKLAQRLNLPSARHLELRNTAIAALALPDLHPIDQLPRKSPGQCNADIDGAFLRYARADENGSISVRRISDGSEIFTLPGAGAERWPLLSRDGQLLSVVSNQGIELWDLEPSPPVNRIPFRDDAVCHSFSLDSRQYVHGNRDGSISIYNLPFAGSPRKIAAKRMATRIAFDPGGQRLAAICGNSVEIRDIATGKLLIELPHRASLESLAWRPDGHGLAVSCNDRHIYLWNVETGQQWMALDEVRNGGMAVAFNHAGNLLASNGWDTTLRLWDLRTTKPLFSTYSVSACIPRFSTDDRRLADDWRDGRLRFWELAVDCGEYRTFVRGESSGNYDRPSVRFDGRMLAVALRDGFGFWDLEGNTQLAFVSVPGCDQVLFEPSGSLLVVGAGGLVRWPVREDSGKKGTFKVGPPQPVSVEGSIVRIDASADGRVIGLSQYDGGRVLRADRLDQPVRLAPQEDARYVAVSADGTRVATASHVRLITRIWDTSLGKLLTELPLTNGHVVFSPDGRWLAGSGSGCSLWNVETGEEGPRIGGSSPAFSPDGKLLATETGYGVIRLVDPHTGLEYARLEDPTQDRALFLTFSPDGTRLIATNDDSRSIHVWDLRKIRNELRKVDLDWDQPAFPLAKPGDRCNLVIQIDLGK